MDYFSEAARLTRWQETGKEAFQLRLWDGRIGRWLTTDPYGQYHSPYLGMGNDPINGIDPDGGFKKDGFWAKFTNWLVGGDGVFWSNKRNEYYVKRSTDLGYEDGLLIETFFSTPVEFYGNANGKADFGLQGGIDIKAFGANIALEGGHDVRSLIEANFDTRKGETYLYNRFGENDNGNVGNYWNAQNDRNTYWGIGGLIGVGSEYETSTRRDNRILGIIPRVGRQKSKELSAIILTGVENYNKYDKGSTLTYKWTAGASLKALIGLHLNFEVGVNFNYYHQDILRKK